MARFYDTGCEAPLGSFSAMFADVDLKSLLSISEGASGKEVEVVLGKSHLSLEDFAVLLSEAALEHLEAQAVLSRKVTQQHFGKTVQLFAPIYLSNECVNVCKYCGFSRNRDIPRITLTPSKVREQASLLAKQGFRSLLLVAGEHPKQVSSGYVKSCVEACGEVVPSVALELGPMEVEQYRNLAEAGAEALVVYQESYHYPSYKHLHTSGPKQHYAWRLDAPERASKAGFRRVGIGVLLGLYHPVSELLALAMHAKWLQKHCWRSQLSLSVLRLRPAKGSWEPNARYALGDRQFVRALCALRLLLPHTPLVLSTRESAELRDHLFKMSITHMSAGSCTKPGGYDAYEPKTWRQQGSRSGEQFAIDDARSPQEVATAIAREGYEPVWKDFEGSLVKPQHL